MYNSSSDLSLRSNAYAFGSVSLNIPASQSQDIQNGYTSHSFYGNTFISPGPKPWRHLLFFNVLGRVQIHSSTSCPKNWSLPSHFYCFLSTITCMDVCNSLLIVLSCERPRSILIKSFFGQHLRGQKGHLALGGDVRGGSGRWEKGGGQPNKMCKENTQVYTCPGETSHFLPKVSSFLIWYKTVIGTGRTAVGLSPMSLSSRDKGGAGAYHQTRTVLADLHWYP